LNKIINKNLNNKIKIFKIIKVKSNKFYYNLNISIIKIKLINRWTSLMVWKVLKRSRILNLNKCFKRLY
jgi:hypothetical protein